MESPELMLDVLLVLFWTAIFAVVFLASMTTWVTLTALWRAGRRVMRLY